MLNIFLLHYQINIMLNIHSKENSKRKKAKLCNLFWISQCNGLTEEKKRLIK